MPHSLSPRSKFRSQSRSKFRVLACLAFFSLAATAASAQAVHAGVQQADLLAGVEYSNFTPNYGPDRMSGIGTFVDADWRRGFGAEAEIRFLEFGGYGGQSQKTYLIGPRAFFLPNSRWRPFGKFLFGGGWVTYPSPIGHGSYFAMAPGGGLDYILSRRWRLRAEYEYQIWPSAPHVVGGPGPSLKPNGASAGIIFRIR